MKKTIFLFIILAALLFSAGPSYAGALSVDGRSSYTPAVDSFLAIIDTASVPGIFTQYTRLHKVLYEVNDPDIHLFYNRKFMDAARAARNKKYEAIAHVLRVEAMYNYRMPDSLLLAESLKALDFMKDVPGSEVHYFYTASVVGDIYMLRGDYEEALRAAELFYNEALKKNNSSGIVASLQSMGKAYEELRLTDKAETAFRESIAAADERTDTGMKGEGYSFLVDMLNGQKRYEDALEVSREFAAYLERIDAYNGELKNLCFLNDLGYAASYTRLGQYPLAWEYLNKAAQFPIAETSLGMYSVENERFALLLEEGRYGEAEQSLDKLADILGDDASYYQANMGLQESRADLYYRWGIYDKAAHAYKGYIAAKDSLQRVEIATRLDALRTQYEVDKLEMQKEQHKRNYRSTLVWFSVALLLLCVIIAVVIGNARRLHAKNRSLLDRIREQDELGKENEEIRSRLASKEISVVATDEENPEAGELYLRFKELMKDPAVFTNPEINRKAIAEKLNTNEKYIFDTVHTHYNMNVSDYITTLRLSYARKILNDSSDHRNIQDIAIDAGFNSRSTFYRIFKDHYGMTPTEFRRLSQKR